MLNAHYMSGAIYRHCDCQGNTAAQKSRGIRSNRKQRVDYATTYLSATIWRREFDSFSKSGCCSL